MPRVNTSNSWKKIPINNLYVGLYDGPHATPKPSSSGPIFLGIKNITEDGRLDLSQIRNISEDDFPKWTKRVLPTEGDIVFSYEATLNLYAMIPKGFRGCLGRRLALIRPNTEIVDPKFLYYSFFGEEWRNIISKNLISGATVDRIPLINFPNFEVSIPLLSIQRKIASVLSNYDDLIENNTRRIEILERMAKLIYEEWFIKFRFPGHEKVKIVPSELGEIPEGWEVKAFSEVINVNPPRKLSKGKLATKVSMADLNTWQSWINSWQKEEYKSGPKFKNGDTLFARITPSLENGKTAFVNFLDDGETAFGSTEFIVFGPKIIESGPYIFFLSRSEYVRETAITAMTGTSGRQRVPNNCFDHLLICVPPNNIVERFNEIVVLFFEMIKNYSKKSLCLRKNRDLLLPKLISGEIDVSDLDIRIKNEYQERNFNFGEPQDEKGLRFKVV